LLATQFLIVTTTDCVLNQKRRQSNTPPHDVFRRL
jgi:hypothetical protein